MRYTEIIAILDFRLSPWFEYCIFSSGYSPASNCSWPTFRNPVSVPSSKALKRRPTKIWRRGNTQKKIYNCYTLWEPYETRQYIVWGKCTDCNAEFRCTYIGLFASTDKEEVFIKAAISFTMRKAPSGPRPPHYRGFMIILRHTDVGRTPLDKWSALSRNLYLTTRNTHNRHPCPRWDSNPQSQAGERPKTHFLDRAANGIGKFAITMFYLWRNECNNGMPNCKDNVFAFNCCCLSHVQNQTYKSVLWLSGWHRLSLGG